MLLKSDPVTMDGKTPTRRQMRRIQLVTALIGIACLPIFWAFGMLSIEIALVWSFTAAVTVVGYQFIYRIPYLNFQRLAAGTRSIRDTSDLGIQFDKIKQVLRDIHDAGSDPDRLDWACGSYRELVGDLARLDGARLGWDPRIVDAVADLTNTLPSAFRAIDNNPQDLRRCWEAVELAIETIGTLQFQALGLEPRPYVRAAPPF